MGEIKSTLEIIMEKSKDLTLTDEERERIQRKEISDRVKAAFQKYLDGFMELEELQRVVEGDDSKKSHWAKEALCEAAIERITIQGDNEKALEALAAVAADASRVRELLGDFQRELSKMRESYTLELRKELEEMGIRGNAVIPNIEAHQQWIDYLKGLEARFKVQLQDTLNGCLKRD